MTAIWNWIKCLIWGHQEKDYETFPGYVITRCSRCGDLTKLKTPQWTKRLR